MIDKSVILELEKFRNHWGKYLSRSPILELDMTWPSVGVLDLLTFHLRLRPELEPEVKHIVSGASAYLAVMAHDIWSKFDVEVSVENGPSGILIRATGGSIPQGQKHEVKIEEQLINVLKILPAPFPVIADFSRMISFDSNVVSLFALGLFTGLCPGSLGVWALETPESFKENLDKAVIELAKQSGEYYSRLFPDEPLGQVGELYLNNLIYPPTLMDETLPVLSAVKGMLSFFKEYKVSRESMLRVTHNLALSPDERISAAGFAFYAALIDKIPPPEIIGVGHAKGRYIGLLRRAMLKVREELGMRPDWMEVKEFTEDDGMRFEIEQTLGFLPWIYFNKAKVSTLTKDKDLRGILVSLADFDFENVLGVLDKMIEASPSDIELRLQRVFLDMILGQAEKAENELKNITSEPGTERIAKFLDLCGLSALGRGDKEGAIKYFRQALSATTRNPVEQSNIANNLGWGYLISAQYEEALNTFNLGLRDARYPVTILLNKAHALWRMNLGPERAAVEKELFEISPQDRRVFANIIFHESHPDLG